MFSCILHKKLCRTRVLLVKAGLSAARRFFGKTPPKHAAEPRDCPCRPRSPQRIGVRVSVSVRVGVRPWVGCSESTCRVEIYGTRPAQSFVQDAAAHSARPVKVYPVM